VILVLTRTIDFLLDVVRVEGLNLSLRISFGLLIIALIVYLAEKEREQRLKNRELFARLQTAVDDLEIQLAELSFLHETSELLVGMRDQSKTLDLVLQATMRFLDAQFGAVILRDRTTGCMAPRAGRDAGQQKLKSEELAFAERIAAHIVETGSSFLCSPAEGASRDVGFPEALDSANSAMGVPIRIEGKLYGLLVFWSVDKGKLFTPADLKMLEILSHQLEMAILNAQLFEEKEEIYQGIIRAFTTAIEAKDPFTSGHSLRVANLAKSIGKKLGLSETELKEIEIAALLHDVGKLGIDERIFVKPSSLTEEEKRIAQSHSVIGADFLQSAKFPSQIVAAVRHHHEHCNGGGYPDGIRGEKIPLGARIISVANSFDAMTSERAFRGAHTPEEALEEIQLDVGTQYDTEVVKAFTFIMDKRVYSLPESG